MDPNELLVAAARIDGHAGEFRTVQDAVLTRAGSVGLGSGFAAAALPNMLAAWEADGVRFDEQFAKHTQAHRAVAPAYVDTDADGADGIDDAGAGF